MRIDCSCGYLLKKEDYAYHLNVTHFSRGESVICTLCGQRLSRIDSFKDHFMLKHNSEARFLGMYQRSNPLSLPAQNQHPIQLNESHFLSSRPISIDLSIDQQPNIIDNLSFDPEETEEIDLDQLLGEQTDHSQPSSLTQLENDLLDSILKVKSNNSGSIKVIRESMIATFEVMHKHFKNLYFNDHSKEMCTKITKNDYQLKKRRVGNISRERVDHEVGNSYYYSIQNILERYVNTPAVFNQLIKERNKQRDNSVIRSILDLDTVK